MSSPEALAAARRALGGAPPVGATLADRYHLVRFLGGGGVGAVYEALTPEGERVAVKALHEVTDTALGREILARFDREAKIAASLGSKYIVPVLEAAYDERLQIPFLVLPLLFGVDLDQLLESVGPLHPTVAVRVVAQACRALEIAHAAGVVHRDIKPANMFLDHDAMGEVTVRILDFGIAKISSDQGLTQVGSIMGTPHFMSPEQSRSSRDVDARADVYSLAATLYHALTGKPPFADILNFPQLHLAINMRDMDYVQDLAPWVDPGLARVVHGGLVRDVDARCPSIEALARALEPYCMGSLQVFEAMLHPLMDDVRRKHAVRTPRVTSWEPSVPSSNTPSMPATTRDALLGTTLTGGYRLLRRIGFGEDIVYEAVAEDRGRYAVELLSSEEAGSSSVARDRFKRKVEALTTLDHDNVLRLVDARVDVSTHQPFLVRELLHGGDLAATLERTGALDPSVVAGLFAQACRGLAAVHECDLVHRDLRPERLFLHHRPSGEVVLKVIGFGVVRRVRRAGLLATDGLTGANDAIGSPMYIAPEQLRSPKDVDGRADIWSVGVCLYQALAGRLPWETTMTFAELAVAIAKHDVPPLDRRAPWVPPELVDVVHRALQRDVTRRFQTMQELAEALDPHAPRTPITRESIGPAARDPRPAPGPVVTDLRTMLSPHRKDEPALSLDGDDITPPPRSTPLPLSKPRGSSRNPGHPSSRPSPSSFPPSGSAVSPQLESRRLSLEPPAASDIVDEPSTAPPSAPQRPLKPPPPPPKRGAGRAWVLVAALVFAGAGAYLGYRALAAQVEAPRRSAD